MQKGTKAAKVAVKNANEVSEVNAEIATLAPANEVPAIVEAPKAETKLALSEKEKTEIKGRKAAGIVETCELTEKVIACFIKEGFTLYPSRTNAAGNKEKAISKAVAGIDKLTHKEGAATVQYFFYSNPLSPATLTEIFGSKEAIPATQKFGTGAGRFNPFIRCDVSKVPALIAASISTSYAAALFASVEAEAKKAVEKAEKAAKVAETTPTGNEAV